MKDKDCHQDGCVYWDDCPFSRDIVKCRTAEDVIGID